MGKTTMQKSYTLPELARFLRRTEKQIRRLAEREILAGRKVRGEWIFDIADVIQWMESEMAELNEEATYKQFEKMMALEKDVEEKPLQVSDLLDTDSVIVPFRARTRESVIRDLTDHATQIGKLWDPEKMMLAIRQREEMMSTAMDNGVAIPHPRRPLPMIISEPFMVLGIAPNPIPFGGGFNNKTDVFFMVCSDSDFTHLQILARLGRILNHTGFLDQLRELEIPAEILELIRETEKKL